MYKDPSYVNGFFGKICRASTIHGVKYIGLRNLHIVERIFWAVAVLVLFGLSLQLAIAVYQKFNANPIIISLQPKAADIARIPFPAITLCNVNILKQDKMQEVFDYLVEEVTLSHKNNDTEISRSLKYAMLLGEHLAHYCLAAPSMQRIFQATGGDDIVSRIQKFLEINSEHLNASFMLSNSEMSDEVKFNVSMFGQNAAYKCDEMILKCIWQKEIVPCKDLFAPISTSVGSCCVFNMMPKFILTKVPDNESTLEIEEEKKLFTPEIIKQWQEFGGDGKILDLNELDDVSYPMHQKSGGRSYGLSLLLNPMLESYGECTANDGWGFKLMAHSPVSIPDISSYGVGIPPRSEVFVDFEPLVSTADDSLQSIDIDKRGCYYPSEEGAQLKSFKFYSASNCWEECIAKATYENCSCVRYYMPKNSTQNLCGATKLKCAESVKVNLTSSGRFGECSKCLPACTEINYHMQVSHFPLRKSSNPNCQSEVDQIASDHSIVHLFFGTDKIHAKERKRLYDASDLLSDAGGLLSLTLGFSLASFVEIFYFCTFRVWFHYKDKKRSNGEENKNESLSTNIKAPKGEMESGNGGGYTWATKLAHGRKTSLKRLQPRKKTPLFHLLAAANEDPPPPYPFLF